MPCITDDKGYNQILMPGRAMEVRTTRRAQKILDEMSVTAETFILELGCGTGELSNFLASQPLAQVVGVDIFRLPSASTQSKSYLGIWSEKRGLL